MIGLLGTFGLIGIEVGISSGMLIAGAMTKPLTYIFIGVFMGHLTLIYLYHGAAPDVDAKISLGIDKAKVVDEGRKQAEEHLAKALPQLGAAIAHRLVSEVMQDLGLQPQMIDAKFLPLDESSELSQAEPSADDLMSGAIRWNWLRGLTGAPRKYEKAVPMPAQVLKENKQVEEPYYHPMTKPVVREVEKVEPDLSMVSPERQRALKVGKGRPGFTVGDVVTDGKCGCPREFFAGGPYSDELQKIMGDVTKGNGVACWNLFGQQEIWLDAKLCDLCPFFKGQPTAEIDRGVDVELKDNVWHEVQPQEKGFQDYSA